MVNDYIQLSWNSDSSETLPIGSYIEYNGEKYSLIEPYSPSQKNETEFVYTPQFKSRVMSWGKKPFFFYSGESKEPDWTLTSNPADFMRCICDAIKEETGEGWSYSIDASLTASASLSFSSADILSGLNQIADAFETEWYADKSTNTIYLGLLSNGDEVTLEVGENINVPSVQSSKEGFYTRFYAFGSTRNITQDYEGSNTNNLINKRLTLDPVKYPNGYKDIKEGLTDGEIFSKILIFDDVYPSAELSISSVRNRLMYRLDSDGKKIQLGTDESGNPIYDQYAIWYFRIEGFDFDLSNIIEGYKLSVSFQSGSLQGREFELKYYDTNTTITTSDGVVFEAKAGDYEILFVEEGSYIIPSMTGLVPNVGDSIVLFNIKMPSEYTQSAYNKLEAELDKEISRINSDLNNYTFKSNPVAFNENNPNLSIGRNVKYVNGSYSFNTRVIKITTHLDFPIEQEITIGNEKVKGNTQQLKEEVASANKDLNLLAVFNDMTQSLQQSYNRTQQMMLDGFAAIKNIWQIKTDSNGNPYAFSAFDVVTQKGITMYADGGELDLPSIYAGIPFDNKTIWLNPETGLVEVLGGTGGGVSNFWDLSNIPSWITATKPKYSYSEIEGTPDLSVYVTSTALGETLADYVKSSVLTSELAKYVTLGGDETITGLKDFTKGLKISGLGISKSQDDVIYIDANLVVRGGITMYAEGAVDIPSILDSLPIASTTSKGIASFDSSYFSVDSDGKVTLLAENVGLNETELAAYLSNNGYATQAWVTSKGYALSADLNALQTKIDDFLEGSDTDTIINKWKELETFLEGLSESDNLATILSDKADKATTLAGYGITDAYTKTNVDDLLKLYVTLATTQTITGEKNFTGGLKVNGSPIVYDATNKYWKLEGDLLVTGGVTMFASDSAFTPSTIMDGVIVDGVTIKKDPTTKALYFAGSVDGGEAGSVAWDNVTGKPSFASVATSGKYSDLSGVPTLLSSFTNDVGYLKSHQTIYNLTLQAGTFSAKTFDPNGAAMTVNIPTTTSHISEGSNLYFTNARAVSALASTLSGYLPLSGGTISSEEQIPITITSNNSNTGVGILLKNSNNVNPSGVVLANAQIGYTFNNGVYMFNYANYSSYNCAIGITNDGVAYVGKGINVNIKYEIWHEGNDGAGSGLDADTLDGLQPSSLSVLSAAKLTTERTIWGQPFDGTGNIESTSDLKVNVIRDANGNYNYASDGNGNLTIGTTLNEHTITLSTKGANQGFTMLNNGNVGIGTASPAQKLHVEGQGFFTSHIKTNGSITVTQNDGKSGYGLSLYGSEEFVTAYGIMFGVTSTWGVHNLVNGDWATYLTMAGANNRGWIFRHKDNGNVASITADGELTVNKWVRTMGNYGWFSQTYGGGIHMSDSQLVRIYGGKILFVGTGDTSSADYNAIGLGGHDLTMLVGSAKRHASIMIRSSSASWSLCSNVNGNMYIGKRNGVSHNTANGDVYTLQLSGQNLLCYGGITMYSDIRKKTKLQDVELSLSQIANAPLIEHYYNSDDKRITHVGSIAQYWAETIGNDWFCKLDSEGFYTMEIQNAALASAISIARELVKYESKTDRTIRKLKQRISELEDEVERLKMN